jgi:hypothetical protein
MSYVSVSQIRKTGLVSAHKGLDSVRSDTFRCFQQPLLVFEKRIIYGFFIFVLRSGFVYDEMVSHFVKVCPLGFFDVVVLCVFQTLIISVSMSVNPFTKQPSLFVGWVKSILASA